MAETFGELLRRHRIARGFTQEALAEHAAISSTAVAALERGRRRAPASRRCARSPGPSTSIPTSWLRWPVRRRPSRVRHSPTFPQTSRTGPSKNLSRSSRWPPAPGRVHSAPASSLCQRQRVDAGVPTSSVATTSSDNSYPPGSNDVDSTSCSASRASEEPRLTARLSQCVHDDGGSIVWGRCSEERLGAYAPFVEILRQLVSAADPVKLSAAVGSRGELTRLIPELVDKVGTLRAPTRAEAGTEQRLLFESVATLLGAWSPLVLVLDDLHWADEATMALLGYLVGSNDVGQLVIVGTVRDTDLDPFAPACLRTSVVRQKAPGFTWTGSAARSSRRSSAISSVQPPTVS